MNIKVISLLIGLAVITTGTAGCSFNREKRQLTNPPQTSPYPHQQTTPFIDNHKNNVNHDHDYRRQPSDSNKVSHDIALNVLELSQRLTARKLDATANSKYEVLSPISITSALQLALLAARGNTFEQLRDVLLTKYSSDYPLSDLHREFGKIIKELQTNEENSEREKVNWRQHASNGYVEKYMRGQSKNVNYTEHKIEMANGIFIHKGINVRENYRDVVMNTYQSEIQTLDFRAAPEQSAKTINDWVKEKTHNKIPTIVPRVMNPNTQAVLVNALYFNAQWQTNFIHGVTQRRPFYPNGRNELAVEADLMAHGGKFPHHYDPETNSDILGFPYKQNSTTMYVILPRDSNRQRLREVQKFLTADKIDAMINNMTIKTTVALFPKMHLSSSHFLKPQLQEMGITSLFNEFTSDLSLLTENTRDLTTSNRNANKQLKNRDDKIVFKDQYIRSKRAAVSYKTPSEDKEKQYQLGFKDFLLKKRIVKNGGVGEKKKTIRRSKRDTVDDLERLREIQNDYNPRLFADEVIHKVDLNINEKGTEGGAATAITLNRSGTQVTFRVDMPFLFLIRHDPTKIPLFYGAVFEPPLAD